MEPNWIKIESGLAKYNRIMASLRSTDVSSDGEFQKSFNGFYRIQRRPKKFYKEYYALMEELKDKEVSFAEILNHLKNRCKTVEASFSSKLLATINPPFPVWDREVLRNLELKSPYHKSKDRIERIISLYDDISKWYENHLKSELGKSRVKAFDKRFTNNQITDIKKVDFIIWQTRENKNKK